MLMHGAGRKTPMTAEPTPFLAMQELCSRGDDNLFPGMPQIVLGRHASSIGANAVHDDDVILDRRIREPPSSRKHVAALADGPAHGGERGASVVQAREVDDGVVRLVERRANERVHPCMDAGSTT